jgi:hypothetical protein
MRTFITAAASVFALALAGVSYAQDTVQNSETDFYVQTSGGVPQMCGFEFTIFYNDRSYRQGALESVTGSLAWGETRGGLGLSLKIVGSDFVFSGATPHPTPFSVLQGFVSVDGKSIRPARRFSCEQPTAFCAAYDIDDAATVYKAIVLKQSVTVGFSRQVNGLDITLPLDTAVTPAKSNQFTSYDDCMLKWIERAEKSLKSGQ